MKLYGLSARMIADRTGVCLKTALRWKHQGPRPSNRGTIDRDPCERRPGLTRTFVGRIPPRPWHAMDARKLSTDARRSARNPVYCEIGFYSTDACIPNRVQLYP
jgi:hypothetical protein